MSPIEVGIIGFIILFALIFLGLPVGASMLAVGFAGLWYFVGLDAAILKMAIVPFRFVSSYDWTVIPLFIFMAHICDASGIAKDLYNAAAKWLGHRRGGLGMATVAASCVFAAISASSIASAATMGVVTIPEMRKHGYAPSLATGCVVAGGTMGVMMPPSTTFIIYALLTGTSIGSLFLAGIIPALIEASFYILTVYLLCALNPELGPRGPVYSFREKIYAFGYCGEIVGLILLALGGLIIGWFTPSEAGAVGAAGSIFFSMIRGRLSWKGFRGAAIQTMGTTGMIFFIVIGASVLMGFVALSNIPTWLSETVGGLQMPPLAILLMIVLVYMILGCIMDTLIMLLLTIPIFFPLAMNLGFDPIWFGVIVVAVAEIGLVTPPIGMNLFVISGMVPDIPMQTIIRGVVPFVIADFCRLGIYIFFPAVALFLPSLR